MILRLAEALGHGELLTAGKILIAEGQDMVDHERVQHGITQRITDRLPQVDPGYFGARNIGKPPQVENRP